MMTRCGRGGPLPRRVRRRELVDPELDDTETTARFVVASSIGPALAIGRVLGRWSAYATDRRGTPRYGASALIANPTPAISTPEGNRSHS